MKIVDPYNANSEKESVTKMEKAISEISKWMFNNKLKLNEDKTEFLIIGRKEQTKIITTESLSIGNETVYKVPSAKNLGVIIDSQLEMSLHIQNTCKICYFHIRQIYKIRRYLTTEATKLLVQATVISRIDYCNSLLYGIKQKLLDRLQKVQNAAARVVTRSYKYDHITPVLKKLHWLPVHYRIVFKLLLLTYKAVNGLAPPYLSSLLQKKVPVRDLRSNKNDDLTVPNWNLKTCGLRSFSVGAPLEWNKLPSSVKHSTSVTMFKKRLKTYLFQKAYNLTIS